MKLIGNLKKQVEQTTSREEARETIARAGMLLEDDELNQVAGGAGCQPIVSRKDVNADYYDLLDCPICGQKYRGTSCGCCGAQGLEQSPYSPSGIPDGNPTWY